MFKLKKYLKILIVFVVFIIFLPVIVLFAIQIKPVQRFIVDKTTQIINEQLNTNVSIGHISFFAPFDVLIKDLYIEDYQLDTLFYINKLKVRPLMYKFRKNELIIGKIDIYDFSTEYRIDSTGYSNFDFFIDNIPYSESDTTQTENSTKIVIKKINIEKSTILYTTQEKDTLPYEFDFDTLAIKNFNLIIDDFYMNDDSISLKIRKLGFVDKSGFLVKSFSANINYSNSFLSVEKLRFRLNKSRFSLDYANFYYNSPDDFSENIENIRTEISLRDNNTFVLSDLQYFSPLFINYNESFKFGITAEGNLGNLYAENLIFKYKNNNFLYADFEIIGLPDIENAFFRFTVNSFSVNLYDLTSLKNPFDNNAHFFELPSDIKIPEKIEYTGGITGNMNDFNLYGLFSTSAGFAEVNFDVLTFENSNKISGLIDLQSFDLGCVMKDPLFGKVTLKDTFFLTLNGDLYSAKNKLDVSEFYFNGYNYKNINSDFYIDNKMAKGFVTVSDSNLVMNLNGEVYLTDNDKTSKVKINVDTAKLYQLNIIKDDPYAALSFGISAEFKGQDIEELQGQVFLTEKINLIKNLQQLTINEFSLIATNTKKASDNFVKNYILNTDIIDAYAIGTFDFDNLSYFFENISSYYFPSTSSDSVVDIFKTEKIVSNDFKFNIVFKDISLVTDIFYPDLNLAQNSFLSGFVNTVQKKYEFGISTDSVILSGTNLINFKLLLRGDTNNLTTTIDCDSIGLSDMRFENFKFSFVAKNDTASTNINWSNESQKRNSGNINANVFFRKDSLQNVLVKIIVPQDTFFVNDKMWVFYSDSINYDSTGILINKTTLWSYLKEGSNVKQYVGLYGKISDNKEDTLIVGMQKFDLTQLNPILPNIKLEGYMMSNFMAVGLMDTPKIVMTSHIDRFAINDVALGDVEQSLKWVDKQKLLHNEITVQRIEEVTEQIEGKEKKVVKIYRTLYVEGDYFIESQSFDFSFEIDNLKMRALAPYIDDYVKFSKNSNLKGKFRIKGDMLFYNILGDINLFGAFLIPETGVNYSINGGMNIKLSNNLIILDTTILVGPKLVGDAMLYGTVKHKDFNDPYIDMYFRADTIAFVDLPRTNKSKYYGKIIASGNFSVKGYLENLLFTADVATEKNTDFTLLLDRPEEVSNKTAIVTFVSPADTVFDDDEEDKLSSNIDIDININLKPDAQFKIIFDELTGEALEIQGEGNVKVKQTSLGDIVLFGKISITRGVYNFVLENILTRKFEIVKGSSIVFNGEPTEGIIDISTLYSIKNVNLYHLLLDENYLEQKTQADCYINLYGPILNPEIRFKVDLPKADQRISGQLKTLDDANINKQFLSLLIFGRFQPLPGLTFNPDPSVASEAFNAGDLISNQLNSLLGNLSSDIDFDVNYETGNEQTSDQFDVQVSIPILNDRVSINSDVGVGGNNPETQSNFIGDFEVDVKLNKKGNLLLKAYNKTNRNEYEKGPYTQGIGILFKKDFDNIFAKDTIKSISDTLK